MACDNDCGRKDEYLFVTRRPSDKSELVSTLALCKECLGEQEVTSKEEFLEHLEGCIGPETIEWLTRTDEALEIMMKKGIMFISI